METSIEEKLAKCLCYKAQTSSKSPSKLFPKPPQTARPKAVAGSRAGGAGACLRGPRAAQEMFTKHYWVDLILHQNTFCFSFLTLHCPRHGRLSRCDKLSKHIFLNRKKLNLDFKGKTGPSESLYHTWHSCWKENDKLRDNLLGKAFNELVRASSCRNRSSSRDLLGSTLSFKLMPVNKSNHRGTKAPEHLSVPRHKPVHWCCSLIP